MLRRLLIASMVLLMAALTALPVANASTPTPGPKGNPNKPTPPVAGAKRHSYFGIVGAVGDSSFVLQPKKGDNITVVVTQTTRIHIPGLKGATIADLEEGDRAAVNGTMGTDGSFTAKKIALAPGKPVTKHHVGTVTAYVAGTSITIADKKGDLFTFKLTADTVVKGQGETVQVAVGDLVTVVARRIPSQKDFTATAIVVHPAKET